MRKLAVALLASSACVAYLALPAAARIRFTTCGKSTNFACGHLTVALDPTAVHPGLITLAMRRHRAPVEGPNTAVIALAGGPGQSAIPFTSDFMELLGPIVSTRDLIVFDQRGTGYSHPLHCRVFRQPSPKISIGKAITKCAAQLGVSRSFYSSADSVADIEAIRQAGGYEKLVLYGTSYGTKVALAYAQRYPTHVEALILDSVVRADGPDPLHLTSVAAVPRILHELCAFHQCAHITRNPVRDLRRLLRRMHHHPLRGRVVGGNGVGHTLRFFSEELLEVLVAGDLEPVFRSEFPAAIHSAVKGDTAALARLLYRAGSSESHEGGIDVPLYYATSCEDQLFPWSPASAPRVRLREAKAKIRAIPARSIAPFSAGDVLDFSDIPACAFWPFPALGAPAAEVAPLPNVPTIILSGADDLRTPTVDARSVAAQIPDSHLLVVPNTGHAVLGTEPTNCAGKAVHALFAAKPIKRCRARPLPRFLRPVSIAPARLLAVAPSKGYRGRPGRTLKAVLLTLNYFARNLVLKFGETLDELGLGGLLSLRVGGLRSGWAGLKGETISFHRYSYVPGVTLTGTIRRDRVGLRVGGAAAAHGALKLGAKGTIIGILGSLAVRLPAGSSKVIERGARGLLARAASGQVPRVPARTPSAPGPLALARLRSRLASTLLRLPLPISTEIEEASRLWAAEARANAALTPAPSMSARRIALSAPG